MANFTDIRNSLIETLQGLGYEIEYELKNIDNVSDIENVCILNFGAARIDKISFNNYVKEIDVQIMIFGKDTTDVYDKLMTLVETIHYSIDSIVSAADIVIKEAFSLNEINAFTINFKLTFR